MRKILTGFVMFTLMIFCFGVSSGVLGQNNGSSAINKGNNAWLRAYNGNIHEIGGLYTSRAILLLEDGNIIQGTDSINRYYQDAYQDFGKVKSIHTEKRLEISPNFTDYEVGYFKNGKNDTYQHLIIWQKENDTWLREFEMVIKKKTVAGDYLAELDHARKKWLTLYHECNPQKLAGNLYMENTVFYHIGVVTQGNKNYPSTYLAQSSRDYQLDRFQNR
jgi:hypothetical protein